MSITLFVIVLTTILSFAAFSNNAMASKMIFYPYEMHNHSNELYRFVTSGFIHANFNHLLFNMMTLWFFGEVIERICSMVHAPYLYMALYISGIIVASIPSYFKNLNNSYFRSLGASGGVAAIIFATVYFDPWNKIYIFFIPIGIPSIIFAVLYLAYSYYMSKKGTDNVGHDAHFWGSLYGFVFALLIDLKFAKGNIFIDQMMHPRF